LKVLKNEGEITVETEEKRQGENDPADGKRG